MPSTTPLNQLADILSDNSLLKAALSRYGVTEEDLREQRVESLKNLGTDGQFLWEVLCALENPRNFDPSTFSPFSIPIILDYLQKTHKYYLDKRMGEIELNLMNIHKKYATTEDSLYWEMIYLLFSAWKRHLYLHIDQEEKALFPYIGKLVEAEANETGVDDAYSLDQFIHQHEDDQLEEGLKEICQSIRKHSSPQGTKHLSEKVLQTQLDLFERDLWVHGLIEDYVLLPKAQEIEERVRG